MSGWLFAIFYIATSPILASILGILIIGGIAFAVSNAQTKKRVAQQEREKIVSEYEAQRSLITQRYEPEIAQKILNHEIWQGMTAEQLRDSAGREAVIETIVMKTKRKEIWKYDQETETRFGTRVTLEDGVVVGWTQR